MNRFPPYPTSPLLSLSYLVDCPSEPGEPRSCEAVGTEPSSGDLNSWESLVSSLVLLVASLSTRLVRGNLNGTGSTRLLFPVPELGKLKSGGCCLFAGVGEFNGELAPIASKASSCGPVCCPANEYPEDLLLNALSTASEAAGPTGAGGCITRMGL